MAEHLDWKAFESQGCYYAVGIDGNLYQRAMLGDGSMETDVDDCPIDFGMPDVVEAIEEADINEINQVFLTEAHVVKQSHIEAIRRQQQALRDTFLKSRLDNA